MTDLIDELRSALGRPSKRASIFDPPPFLELLRSRVEQLSMAMIDGVAIEPAEAEALRRAIGELVATEAVAALPADDMLHTLEMMEAFGYEVDEVRRRVTDGAVGLHPPPPPLSTPVVDALLAAARQHPGACELAEPIANLAFLENVRAEGLDVPDDLLALLAVCDGFDLWCVAARYLPVFSLLPSGSFDVLDPQGDYPRRLAVFQGGDDVELALYRDAAAWWLTFEVEFAPCARTPYDLDALLRFALARLEAGEDQLADELDWPRFFAD